MAASRQLLLSLLVLLSYAALSAAGSTTLVINEVDYDQPGTDTAEFVEIKNVGGSSIALSGWNLVLVNGGVSPPAIYKTIALAPVTLAPGAYFVVCSTQGGTVANCNQQVSPATDLIQNGPTDAMYLSNPSGTIIDKVSYEGIVPGYSEGTTAGTDDGVGAQSLSRCSDGADTDDNGANFQLVAITPGASNACPSGPTPAPTTKTSGPTPAPTTQTPTPAPAQHGFSCKNAANANVDWWVALKFPKQSAQNADGGEYAYIDSTFDLTATNAWSILTNMQTSARDDALANTLYQIYDNQATAGYALWNDEYPATVATTAGSGGGHAKGILGLSATQGFYLVHNAPKFPDPPSTSPYAGIASGQLIYGQSFLCTTLRAAQLDGVAKFVQSAGLWIYDSQLPSAIAGPYPHFAALIAAKDGSPTPGAPTTVSGGTVATSGGQAFALFQKPASAGIGLYESLVEPYFGLSMAWETWQNSGTNLNSCPTTGSTLGSYTIRNISVPEAQATTPTSGKWAVTSDHAKWGVPYPSGTQTVCIGDMNRQASQANRGGGTVCFLNNANIVRHYTKLIVGVNPCA